MILFFIFTEVHVKLSIPSPPPLVPDGFWTNPDKNKKHIILRGRVWNYPRFSREGRTLSSTFQVTLDIVLRTYHRMS